MSENTITALRGHLFDTMRALKDKEQPMDIERAKAIADVAQTIINSAKVEVEHMKVAGGNGSGFIPDGDTLIAKKPGLTVTRHTLKG